MKTITGSSSAAEALGANAAEGSRGTMVAPYADDPGRILPATPCRCERESNRPRIYCRAQAFVLTA